MTTPKLDLGQCEVYFGTAGAEVIVSKTEGGVKVNFTTDVKDLMTDQAGTSPEDGVIVGQGATIVCPFAQYQLNVIAIALNQARTASGGHAGIKGGSLIGTKMSTLADSLLLKKYVDGVVSTTDEDWIRFPNAAPEGNISIAYDKNNQRIIEVTFRAYCDANGVLYYFGNEGAAESGS